MVTAVQQNQYCRKQSISLGSEACVERAFSKHKKIHSNLRASLSTDKVDDQLFIRYNFENIMNIAFNPVSVDDSIFEFENIDDSE